MKEKEPEMREMKPIWWHPHGAKMKLKAVGIQNDILLIQSNAAEVVITRASSRWWVNWKINHGFNAGVLGKTLFSSYDFSRAFGLRDDIPKFGEWLIERYGGTTARQFCFIRYKQFLNIPAPGTGHDGDPNVSIEIDEEMKKAAEQLINNQRLT